MFLLISTINEGQMPVIRKQQYKKITTKIEAKKNGKEKRHPDPDPCQDNPSALVKRSLPKKKIVASAERPFECNTEVPMETQGYFILYR